MSAELPLVLLVEDKQDMRELMAAHLKKLGYEVSSVASFAEGEAALATGVCPQVLIADQDLGDGDGAQLIREWQAKRKIAYILWTGDTNGAGTAASVAADYLPKICSRQDIATAVSRALEKLAQAEASAIVDRHVAQINSDRQKRNRDPLSEEVVDEMKQIVTRKPIGLREIDRLIALVTED